MIFFWKHCDVCGSDVESRVYEDSWTGIAMCLDCLYHNPSLVGNVTMSPDDPMDGDNLREIVNDIRQANGRKPLEDE